MEQQVTAQPEAERVYREDGELVAACLEGDAAAWETLILRYRRLIYSIPIKARLSVDDAADIFQSVCLKMFKKLASLRDHQKLSSWLITTTTRECWRLAAHNRREGTPIESDGEHGAESLTEIPDSRPLADQQRQALEEQQQLRAAVSALQPRCRALLTMLFYEKEELPYAEIGRRLGMPVPSIGPTRARCLEKLKRLLESRSQP